LAVFEGIKYVFFPTPKLLILCLETDFGN